jgi:hypothetical protein
MNAQVYEPSLYPSCAPSSSLLESTARAIRNLYASPQPAMPLSRTWREGATLPGFVCFVGPSRQLNLMIVQLFRRIRRKSCKKRK